MRPSTEGGRIKVAEQIIWVNVVPPDGIPRRYVGYSGESLLAVLDRNYTPGVHSDCGGGDREHTFAPHQVPVDYYSMGMSCGQCQVIISDPHFDKSNKVHSAEQTTLDRAVLNATVENSRLACCVQLRPELNELIVVVANNRSQDGDWFSGKQGDSF